MLVLAGLGAAPDRVSAFSDVTITEVMYNEKGSDAGHEWIELTNFGDSTRDIKNFLVEESKTNHKISVFSGGFELSPGNSLIVANNPATFAASYPNYTGSLLKAAISLSNSGETLVLKDASSSVVDTVSYSSSKGANGDGNSLHRLSIGLRAGKPDPGVYSDSLPTVAKKAVSMQAPTAIVEAPHATNRVQPRDAPEQEAATGTDLVKPPHAALVHTSEARAPQTSSLPVVEGALGLVALCLLAVASVWYAKGVTDTLVTDSETNPKAEEFDIEG